MRLCGCGCGKPVRKEKHSFLHGHNGKITLTDPKIRKKIKAAMIKKYGVENCQQIKEIKQRSVDTRWMRYDHWFGNLDKDKLENIKKSCSKGGKIGGQKQQKDGKPIQMSLKDF